MTIFGQNSGLTPLEKCQFFDFLKFLFLQPTRRLFVPEYRKRTFPGLYCLRKKKFEKWPFLDQNHALTPLEQCQVFDFLNFFFLQPRKAFFFFQNIVKDISLAYIAYKKKLEKWSFLKQNHGLTPLEKCQFYEFLNFLFFIAQKDVFSFQNIVEKHFLAYIALKKKVGKIAIFGPKPWVNTFGKMSIFRLFELLVFIAQKGVFSF